MIAEVERGFYAVSFAGGQVDPTTGDFVFGVSEGYLIEAGKVTTPCRGATLIGNCLDALGRIDAVADDFEMKTGFCGKGGQRVPVGTGQGHVRIGELTVGGRRSDERRARLSVAGRAVEAALAAGAGDAEAYAQDSSGLEVRVFEAEVESLTEAGERGRRGAGLDRRPRRLRLRHRPRARPGCARSPPARSRRRGSPTTTSSPAPPEPGGRRRGRSRACATRRSPNGRPSARSSWPRRSSAPRASRRARGRDRGRPSTRTSAPARRDRLLRGRRRAL